MELMEAIKGRRSVRQFRPDPVSDEQLNTIFEAAHWAPSWANTQCWRFVVVRDTEIKARLAGTIYGTRPGSVNRAQAGFKEAPVGLAVCADTRVAGFYVTGQLAGQPITDKGGYWFMFDTASAVQNLTLAAHSLGLGTVHIGVFHADQARQIVGAPDGFAVVVLMALGWPAVTPVIPPRKALSEIVVHDKFLGN